MPKKLDSEGEASASPLDELVTLMDSRRAGLPTKPEKVRMPLQVYTFMQNGRMITLKLSDEDAIKRGLEVKKAPESKNKKVSVAKNKAKG